MTWRSPLLTDEERERIAQHINDKAKLECPVCKQNKFFVAEFITAGVPIDPRSATSNISTSYQTMPLASVYCENCYFVMQFAAVPLGFGRAGPS